MTVLPQVISMDPDELAIYEAAKKEVEHEISSLVTDELVSRWHFSSTASGTLQRAMTGDLGR